ARGDGQAHEIAALYHNLAGIELVLGNPVRAEQWARQGLHLRRVQPDHDELSVLLDEGNLAPILIANGKLEEAEQLLARLLVQFIAILGPNDYEVAVTLTNLGGLAAQQGRLEEAHRHLNRAIEIKTDILGPDHPELIRTLI